MIQRFIPFTRIARFSLAAGLAASFAACGDGGGDSADDLQSCVEDDFAAMPLSGAGYRPETGLVAPVQESYIAHTTFLIVNPDERTRFDELVGPILADLATREGLVAYSLGGSEKCGTVRTMGVWTDEAAMVDFVLSDAHAAAIAESPVVGLNGATTHWEVLPDEIPMSWDLARTKISETTALY